jgi:hypothetical protein
MNKFDCIIPLGETCNITFLIQNCNIKKETTLFEWFVTNSLNNITNIINKLSCNYDINIIQNGGQINIEDDNIFSGHYSTDEFISIYKRRANRLLECIKKNKKILFIRFETNNTSKYTEHDIESFFDSIKSINKDSSDMRLLLISPQHLNIQHPFLINKYCDYNIIHSDPYCSSDILNKIFVDILKSIGYNNFNSSNIKFDDKSNV